MHTTTYINKNEVQQDLNVTKQKRKRQAHTEPQRQEQNSQKPQPAGITKDRKTNCLSYYMIAIQTG